MKGWLRRRAAVVVFVFAVSLMSAVSLTDGSVAVSGAQPWCPVGWYWNDYTRSCQPIPGPAVTACISGGGRRGYVRGGVCISN